MDKRIQLATAIIKIQGKIMDKPLPESYLNILRYKSFGKLLLVAFVLVVGLFILRNLITANLESSEITVKTAAVVDFNHDPGIAKS